MNFCPVCGSEPVIYVTGRGISYCKTCGWWSDFWGVFCCILYFDIEEG